MSVSEDFLVRIKTVLLMNMVAILGMLLNLLLYTLNAEVVMDDLIDAIVKVTEQLQSKIFYFVFYGRFPHVKTIK